ncbi:MAG: DUF4827 family protein [Paludibacter sp.]
MKLLKKLFTLTIIIAAFSSCIDEVTYADQLKDEQKLISKFISRNNIKVVKTIPSTFPWPENVYYKTSSGLYFRLEEQGDSIDSLVVEDNDKIIMRYIRYTLNEEADTSYYDNTVANAFPVEFNYNDLTSTTACEAWHEAVSLMKYNNSAAKIIVYSKLGFEDDESSVIPYGYDMRIKIRK